MAAWRGGDWSGCRCRYFPLRYPNDLDVKNVNFRSRDRESMHMRMYFGGTAEAEISWGFPRSSTGLFEKVL